MPQPRRELVDPEVTRWYHCISNCVRRTTIPDELKLWGEARLRELAEIFAIDVGSYSLLDTHFHLLLYLDISRCESWSNVEVLERWARLHPPRGADRKPLPDIRKWIIQHSKDETFVRERRERLSNLGWFMKSLKEPIARLANELEQERGTFWSGRYKSIAVLDELALLNTSIYVDLNPFAAGIVQLPEQSNFTSLWERLEHFRFFAETPLATLREIYEAKAVLRGYEPEKDLWLCPIEDRREEGGSRLGMFARVALDGYLTLLDETARLERPGKQHLAGEVEAILSRLDATEEIWRRQRGALCSKTTLFGNYYASQRESLQSAARARGIRQVPNLNGSPTR